MDNLIGCWIDGAYPRTNRERCFKLLDLWAELDTGQELAKEFNDIQYLDQMSEDEFFELEDELIDRISEHLPDNLQLIREAGDIIVTNEIEG